MTKIRLGSIAAVAAVALVTLGGLYAIGRNAGADEPRDLLPDSADYAASVVDRVPAAQAAALADGEVSFDEYEAAIQATIRCAEAAGLDLEVTPAEGMRPSQVGFAAPSIEDAEADRAKLEACRAEHLGEIETTWALQQARPSQDEVRRAHERLTQCMQEQGFAIADGFFSVEDVNALLLSRTSAGADPQALHAYAACKPVVAEELGYTLP